MSSVKFPIVGGRTIRGTRLDNCGTPDWGDAASIVTEGFVQVAVTANYEDGEEITITSASGRRCVNRAAEPELTNLSLDIEFCEVDPDFYTLATGFPQILDPATGDTIGFRINRGVRPNDTSLALELWSSAQGSIGCDDSGDVPWVYFLWPYLTGGRVSDFTIENAGVTFTVSGMVTKDGSRWGEGPYIVQNDADGIPDFLQTPVDPLDHQLVFRTLVAPPPATIGLVPLDDPDEGPASGATAGAPGAFSPEGAVRPSDLAALQASAIVATPATAWTTGEHLILGDGSHAHWDGDSWEAGEAP